MTWALMGVGILVMSFVGLANKIFNSRFLKNNACYFFYMMLYYALALPILVLTNGGLAAPSAITLGLGILYGMLAVVGMYTVVLAMGEGPMVFAILVISFNMIIPISVGSIVWREAIGITQWIGMALLIPTLFLVATAPAAKGTKKPTKKWYRYIIINTTVTGIIYAMMKTQQMVMQGTEINEYLFIGFAVTSLCSAAIWGFFSRVKGQSIKPLFEGGSLPFFGLAAGMAVTFVFGTACTAYVASRLPAAVQFPIQGCAGILMQCLWGFVFYRERLTRKGVAGIAVGLVAILCLSL